MSNQKKKNPLDAPLTKIEFEIEKGKILLGLNFGQKVTMLWPVSRDDVVRLGRAVGMRERHAGPWAVRLRPAGEPDRDRWDRGWPLDGDRSKRAIYATLKGAREAAARYMSADNARVVRVTKGKGK